MKTFPRWLLFLAVALSGCQDKIVPAAAFDPEAAIRANLAELSAADRALAERQRFCPLMPKVRLGAKGTPTKITVNGEAVFVCCGGCVRQSQDDPESVAVRVKEFKAAMQAQAAAPKP